MADDYSQYAADGDNWGGDQPVQPSATTTATAAGQEGEKTFEDVYRTAFLYYANLLKSRRDPDHDFVENPDLIEMPGGADCEDFLYRIGQPDVTTTFPEFTQEAYTCNDLYDIVCDFGVASKVQTTQFSALLSTLHLLTNLSSAFLSKDHRTTNPDDMTTILLGEVVGEGKSSIKTAFTTPQYQPAAQKEFFASHKDTFFTTECTIELCSAQSKEWCKSILTNATNILSIASRQFLGNTFSIAFEDPSPTLLTIKFLANAVDPVIQANVTLFLNELTAKILPLGFQTQWKWAVSFEEIFTVPLSDLLQTQVSLSLPTVGVKPEYLAIVKTLPIPYEMFDCKSFDELQAKIPGLDDIVNKTNFKTTLDLRNFVSQTLTTLLNTFNKNAQNDLKQMNLLNIVSSFAPLIFDLITPFLSHGLTLLDCLSALKSAAQLAALIFARDFNAFTSFSAKCASGHALSFDSKNIFQMKAFFNALDLLFGKLEDQIKLQPVAQ